GLDDPTGGAAATDLADEHMSQKPTRDHRSRSRVERRRQGSAVHGPPVSPRFTLDQKDSPPASSGSGAGSLGDGGGGAGGAAGSGTEARGCSKSRGCPRSLPFAAPAPPAPRPRPPRPRPPPRPPPPRSPRSGRPPRSARSPPRAAGAARRNAPAGGGAGPHRRRRRRVGHGRIERFVGFGHRVADLDRVGAVIVLGEVDQLTVVRLAQQLLHLGRLDGLGIALDLGHGFAELFGAHRAGFAAQAADRLLDHAEGTVQRERAAALLGSDFGSG